MQIEYFKLHETHNKSDRILLINREAYYGRIEARRYEMYHTHKVEIRSESLYTSLWLQNQREGY